MSSVKVLGQHLVRIHSLAEMLAGSQAYTKISWGIPRKCSAVTLASLWLCSMLRLAWSHWAALAIVNKRWNTNFVASHKHISKSSRNSKNSQFRFDPLAISESALYWAQQRLLLWVHKLACVFVSRKSKKIANLIRKEFRYVPVEWRGKFCFER